VYLEAQLVQLKPNSTVFSDTGERIVSAADRLKQARSQLASARALYAPDHPDVIRLTREVEGLEKTVGSAPGAGAAGPPSSELNDLRRRLQSAEAALTEARQRYSPEHPDRIRLEREVTDLQAQLAASPASAAPAAVDAASMKPIDADNPAYVSIQAQLSATRGELAALATEMNKLRTQAEGYQHNLTLAPQVEKEYRELSRDYDNARVKYAEIRSKMVEAKTAQDLESDRKGERFTLIEPPLPPEEPVSPNRRLILVFGFVLSAALTAGLLWFLESVDRRSLWYLTSLRLVRCTRPDAGCGSPPVAPRPLSAWR
jgi:uncharacterized protein involved in exopolysaccharide biosynthesis